MTKKPDPTTSGVELYTHLLHVVDFMAKSGGATQIFEDICVCVCVCATVICLNSDLVWKCNLFYFALSDRTVELHFTCRITHALFHWLTHTPNQFFAAAAALASYFPEVLISCLALRPPLPSSLCPHCPEHSREQPTLPLDWRLYLLQINRNKSMCSKLMKICAKNKKSKKIIHPLFVSFRVFCTSNGRFRRPWGSNVLEVKSNHFTLFQSLELPRISQHTEAFTVRPNWLAWRQETWQNMSFQWWCWTWGISPEVWFRALTSKNTNILTVCCMEYLLTPHFQTVKSIRKHLLHSLVICFIMPEVYIYAVKFSFQQHLCSTVHT